jgi:choline dehydrogenase-like flavoprotein
LEDFASDEREQEKLYWNDTRVVDGANPITMGGKNSGKAVGGSTVHFAMVSLRFRPEWFRSRSLLDYWRRLAARLAGDVGVLPEGGTGSQHLRASDLSVGS